jgi:hypothetical protein
VKVILLKKEKKIYLSSILLKTLNEVGISDAEEANFGRAFTGAFGSPLVVEKSKKKYLFT